MTAPTDVQAEARQWVAQALASGAEVSGSQVGQMFGRSDRWGRDVLASVRAELEHAEAPRPGPVEAAEAPEVRAIPQVDSHPGARLVAWAGFLFGTVISVAANVLAAWIPPEDAAEGWQPGIAPQAGAAVWPLALLLSVEVLSRVRFPAGWQWAAAKFGGVVAVAAGAAVISYGHIRDVLAAWGYGTAGAHVGPLVVDGLMVISGFALLALSRGGGSR